MGVGPFQPALARDAVRKFCVLYGALSKEADENGHTHVCKVKPKFQCCKSWESTKCSSSATQGSFLAYADEVFVGWVAALACSRGGKQTASTTPKNVLDRYKALTSFVNTQRHMCYTP